MAAMKKKIPNKNSLKAPTIEMVLFDEVFGTSCLRFRISAGSNWILNEFSKYVYCGKLNYLCF